jgi:hypothetical protein
MIYEDLTKVCSSLSKINVLYFLKNWLDDKVESHDGLAKSTFLEDSIDNSDENDVSLLMYNE